MRTRIPTTTAIADARGANVRRQAHVTPQLRRGEGNKNEKTEEMLFIISCKPENAPLIKSPSYVRLRNPGIPLPIDPSLRHHPPERFLASTARCNYSCVLLNGLLAIVGFR
ncbi:hypothetical protein ACLOJK_024914 [Asimina triloba]